MRYLLNFAYVLALVAVSPWLIYCAVFRGKYRQGFGQKLLGLVPSRSGDRTCVWLHAVSVGEINVLQPLLARIAAAHPDWQCVISTTTRTGFELACRKYSQHTVFYCPLDFSWAVDTALSRVRPDLLVLTELELWPNLIRAAKRRGTRVAIINGRLSERSARGYARLRRIIEPLLGDVDLAAMQTDEYAARIRELGAPAERVRVMGSIKFDGAETSRRNPRTEHLARLAGFQPGDVVLLAGSTQHPEEELALETFLTLREEWPSLRLVLAPRHPERFDQVAAMLARRAVPWERRTALEDARHAVGDGKTPAADGAPARILLVDTIGELGAWWGTCHIAFVGGSLGRRGGQNMIEPAAYGAAVSFGPNTRNFRDVVTLLLDAEASVVVRDGAELTAFARRCLEEPLWAQHLGERARQLVRAQVGASDRTLAALETLLNGTYVQRRSA